MVTAELKDAEMFKPNILAKQEIEKSTSQYLISVNGISKIKLPNSKNKKVWMAEKTNITVIFETR